MSDDQLEDLIKQAHNIIGETSIYEVFDLDRKEAIEVLEEYYGPVLNSQKIEEYFPILEQIHDTD